MPRIRLERGPVVCENGVLATSSWARTKGLLGRASIGDDEGLWIQPTSSIHMWFMRFSIDAVFLDQSLVVLRIVRGLRPWRMAGRRGAKAVLELAAGAADRGRLGEGDRLILGAERAAAA